MSQKTYLELDDVVPSWIGAVIAVVCNGTVLCRRLEQRVREKPPGTHNWSLDFITFFRNFPFRTGSSSAWIFVAGTNDRAKLRKKGVAMRLALVLAIVGVACNWCRADITVGFEELNVFTGNNPAGGGQFYNGNAGTGVSNSVGWSSQGVFFNNTFTNWGGGFESWRGWAYSNVSAPNTPGFSNQYAARPGNGAAGSSQYALAYGSGAFFNLPTNSVIESISLANTSYTYFSMQQGDAYAKKFGGDSGDDLDFFSVTLHGFSGLGRTGSVLGSIEVMLADFRFSDNSLDFILDSWTDVNLSSLAGARSLSLEFKSSDMGTFGINTPVYVAMDNLRFSAVPEPSSLALVAAIGIAAQVWRRRSTRRKTRDAKL